ncbi:ribosome maturation factor RimM [Marinoscillum furvescens]|uniref:Ribosome maturation factor RimM n=1 Tax=Marinoscillum furvescens DSM 4134 TaxID=1122208 RepID=A0A3D9LGY6_MARFU|nr:ribosome maturation factor RimM [Marinoscillum furvescens]REE05877.1 16S rRNA processing protein RimM [Marinoscillum furvescens DSM 4134]
MGFDECYQLGNVVKTHGLRGELVFFLDVDFPEQYQEMESVFVELSGKLVPFFVESFHLQGERAIVALEEIESIEDAKPLVGKNLFLPLDRLPQLPEGKYYFHQLVGFELYDRDQLIGAVTAIYELPTYHLLNVDHQGVEVLVPAEDGIIQSVDLKEKVIKAELPDGLLDVYLEDKS